MSNLMISTQVLHSLKILSLCLVKRIFDLCIPSLIAFTSCLTAWMLVHQQLTIINSSAITVEVVSETKVACGSYNDLEFLKKQV